jgi:hypothetical protein
MAMQEVRERLRQRLESEYGVDEAGILMDRPPGGWSDLVTNESLNAKLDAVRFEVIATMEREIRAQTWRLLTVQVTTTASFAALVGVFIAVARP